MFPRSWRYTHLGRLQELENQLHQAAETYRRVLQTAGQDQLGPNTNDAWLGLARICYEWNDLQGAEHYAQRSLQQAHQFDRTLDRFIIGEVFLAR
jgi:LuxR family transcriptional regulator, maltose regulon positive regulatory protein